jgi:hypothetical protein
VTGSIVGEDDLTRSQRQQQNDFDRHLERQLREVAERET